MKPERNWLITQAQSADPSYGSVTLENPDLINELDQTLKTEIWPPILGHLNSTNSSFEPHHEPRISSKKSCELMRSLEFMLFDELGRAISRIQFQCGKSSWMIKSEFFLGLPQETDFRVIHDLIANSRMTGIPPTLEILKRYPESYFNITFQNGSGESWGKRSKEEIIGKVKRVVDVNIQLFEQSIEGLQIEDVSEFLTSAYEVYEAY